MPVLYAPDVAYCLLILAMACIEFSLDDVPVAPSL